MFNFFSRKTAKDFMEQAKETYVVPPMPTVEPPKPKEDKCFYTVGTTQSGKTVLRMCDESGYSSLSLTMNEAATRQMIRMLEATLTEEDDVETDPISD